MENNAGTAAYTVVAQTSGKYTSKVEYVVHFNGRRCGAVTFRTATGAQRLADIRNAA